MSDLSLKFPVLLGPVRIETRYSTGELRVRVFPDEWSVDKFEPRPTQAELAAIGAYWTAYWASGRSPIAEQAAWHQLVARVPIGRATWLIGRHEPADLPGRPGPPPDGAPILVVVSEQPLAEQDRQPTITYWTSVWRAHGDRRQLREADIALLTAVGPQRASAIRARRPSGVDTAPVSRGTNAVVSFMVFTPPAAADIAPRSWTVAAKAKLLPDRFTVYGYRGDTRVFAVEFPHPVQPDLVVSPDPAEPRETQLRINEDTGALTVPKNLLWLTDFEAAITAGMGVRIPLTDPAWTTLDRLVVLGLRAQVAPEQSAADFAGLLTDQLRSPAGFSLLPQGTPTNNTEQAAAGPDPKTEATTGLATAAGFATATEWTDKKDGQWFAELLGIDPATLKGVPNAEIFDRRDARAAHTALWPATWGNYLQSLLGGVLTDAQIAQTRKFFLENVSGRGPLPAVKIGRQPYGILPTTVFSRMTWPAAATHRIALNGILTRAAKDWKEAVAQVSYLHGPAQDKHQKLLNILALHPTSTEYHHRYAQSATGLDQVSPEPIRALLTGFGGPDEDPDLLRRLFAEEQLPLLAPVVDDRPLSEVDPIRAYTDDERNYLRWLADYALTDLEKIRKEIGFTDNKPPSALLYFLARHAVLLGYAEAARRLALTTPGADVPDSREAAFIHIEPGPARSESRYRALYSTDPAINPDLLVHEHLRTLIGDHVATTDLAEQVAALGVLAGLPTARLERVFAEHIDVATYRLDAWRLGLVNERLAELRYGQDPATPPVRGLHLGAYGWLENVAKKQAPPTQPVPAGLTTVFGTDPIPVDANNGGYIHAPSPSHARTAAVLRAGYLANGTPDDANMFAINLSSRRVRIALTIVDGLRQGQSLGALLGQRFERALHDTNTGVDKVIAGLRLKFPLRANRIDETRPKPTDPAQPTSVEQIEARNVIDGLTLLRHVDGLPKEQRAYPFDFTDLEAASSGQKKSITAELDGLRDVHDALADLMVAEGTHQALQGNHERASSTLDAFTKDGLPAEPAIVDTPRSGTTLTHRLGLQFESGLDPDHDPTVAGPNNPRARAEPAINDWLRAVLPLAQNVVALVTWKDPDGRHRERVVTQQEAGLQRIDLLWALRPNDQAAMSDLDDRILGVVLENSRPRPDIEPVIEYTTRVAGKVSFFELSPLIAALRTLLTTSRPLRPSDLVPAAGSATVGRADDAVSLPRERPAAVRASLTELVEEVDDFLVDLGALYPAQPVRAEILKNIDTFLGRYARLTVTAGGFGLIRSSWGELAAWRRGLYKEILAAVAGTAARMRRALKAADALLLQYENLPSSTPAEERFRILLQAQRLVVTKPGPRKNTPAEQRLEVRAQRSRFNDRLTRLERQTSQSTLSGLLAEVRAQLPLTDIDPEGLDLTPFEDRVVDFGRELLTRADRLQKDLAERGGLADKALVIHDQAIPGPERVRAATDALKVLLGEDVLAVPEFTPPDRVIQQWRAARDDSADLVAHLKPARDYPIDDWLHGMARVREMPRLWEKTILLADALLGPGGLLGTGILGWKEPALSPIQLPYVDGDHWLGLEFAKDPDLPLDRQLREDRLLFTACYATGLGDREQCGLLLDEWTEVIPAERETTGIAVHYDRPDAEPPQAMLLVVPPIAEPDPQARWEPGDLVDAVAETFAMAKTRAVEPDHLGHTGYAHLLPATVMSATREPVTISTDLALANLRWKADHD
ncbi:hypothetical protein D5S17_05510 [Pseudonocardiaceae bacterium YIM PH 21723]|nr:hypothetical protein D5S17_05510 [Pseudonocardiaceae bacterium YIM PH 21723]